MSSTSAPVARSEKVTQILPTRRTQPLQVAQQHQPFRVLQTSRAPAQLSLFLRPATVR
jgi:hypothetical protein